MDILGGGFRPPSLPPWVIDHWKSNSKKPLPKLVSVSNHEYIIWRQYSENNVTETRFSDL